MDRLEEAGSFGAVESGRVDSPGSLASAWIQPIGCCGLRLEAGGERVGVSTPHSLPCWDIGRRCCFPQAQASALVPSSSPPTAQLGHTSLGPPPTLVSPGYSSVLLALSPRGGCSKGSCSLRFPDMTQSNASSHPPSCPMGGGRNTAVNKANKTPSLV